MNGIGADARPPKQTGRSIAAVLVSIVAVVIVTVLTDIALHVVHVFPPMGESMVGYDKALGLATAYRTLYGIAGSYLTARLAPYRPLLHSLIGGCIGLVVSALGAVLTWNKGPAFSPHWYPIALIILAMPTAWVGAKIREALSQGPR